MANYHNKDAENQEIIKKFHIGSINSHGHAEGAWTDQMEKYMMNRKGS